MGIVRTHTRGTGNRIQLEYTLSVSRKVLGKSFVMELCHLSDCGCFLIQGYHALLHLFA